MSAITLPAYAKLNLTLDILGKRADGYHEMQMVMQTISLHDTVTVSVEAGSGITCRVAGAELPCDETNLAVRAARAFLRESGIDARVAISLEKRIPSEAGMAGGSADAAAVLRALRALLLPALSDEALAAIGALVGSDVPFCVRGGTQLAEGRGERLTALTAAPRLYAAVCKPDFPITTPALFARADSVTLTDHPDTAAMLAAIDQGDTEALCSAVENAFEQVLPPDKAARIAALRRALLDRGAACAAMTGSGSAVFGLFSEESAAREAGNALRNEKTQVFCAAFV